MISEYNNYHMTAEFEFLIPEYDHTATEYDVNIQKWPHDSSI
jgi:hypothetical protein